MRTTVTSEPGSTRCLSAEQVTSLVLEGLGRLELDGRRLLVIVPDSTRTMPMARMRGLIERALSGRVQALDYLVALGTHPPMSEERLSEWLGCPVEQGRAGQSRVFNHAWDQPERLVCLGRLGRSEVEDLTGGLLAEQVPVTINRLILDYDAVLVCGPVFPHEVVGFSGGSKYLFPGVAGREIIDFMHWLGAMVTSFALIGCHPSVVRAVIDRAARLIDRPLFGLALVVDAQTVWGVFCGGLFEAWEAARSLSAERHIHRLPRPFRRVLSMVPEMYQDLWTAAKGMYKLEPVVEDGGEIVLYAPHLQELSRTHGHLIEQIGYHCRDYFLAQWDRFSSFPRGVLAHSTHLKGRGEYDPKTGVETPRITVTLATGISESRCRRLNLGYLDPQSIVLDHWLGRENEGILVVPRAGETLYRLASS